MKVIKPAYLIASFPLTQLPLGTETSAKGCFVIEETPCVASRKGWKPTMGHFQMINGRNGVKINISSVFVFNIRGLASTIIVIRENFVFATLVFAHFAYTTLEFDISLLPLLAFDNVSQLPL